MYPTRARTSCVLLALLITQPTFAAGRVDYLRDIKPVLAARCYACHGGLQQKSGLRLDTVALMKKGGDKGPAIVAGKSGESALVAHVTGKGRTRMPPRSEGEGLKKDEIARIRAWIDEGAIGPTDEKAESDPRDHWAFRPPVRAVPPVVKNAAWVRNPIDSFLAAGHEKKGLVPQPEADRRVLLRRVTIGLTGLPPTAEEMKAFLEDRSPGAYEKVVRRLLSSPRYGERWGRHWMDVWRYSDWWGLGAEVRNSQKHIWHWRDWVLESVNEDKGYDQMVREMLAADELYPTDQGRLRATGFLARPYFKFNRNTWLEDVVEHTSKGLLGLTMNCAKCHDHKYDPIAQEDFYRFRAFFEPYQLRTDITGGETDFEKDGVPRAFDCNLTAPTYLFVRGDEKRPRKKPLLPGLPAVLLREKLVVRPVDLPPEAHSPGAHPETLKAYLRIAEKDIEAARGKLAVARAALAEAGKKPLVGVKLKALVRDDFAKERPEFWEKKAGKWKYQGGKLLQEADGPIRAVLRLKQAPPTDFVAKLRYTPTGGKMWLSTGTSFDVAGDNEVLVYLSAFKGGPKVQVSYKQGGAYVYPPGGMVALPVKLNEEQALVVRARGQLLNVEVNGRHVLSYRLPIPRKAGAMELITYDARVSLAEFELSALPVTAMMVPVGGKAAPRVLTAEQAKLSVAAEEKGLATALLRPEVLKASVAADRAKLVSAADAKELARKASQAERRWKQAQAEEAVARAELEVALAPATGRVAAEKKLAAARAARTVLLKKADEMSEVYASLRGSLKTLESNVETQASRDRLFPRASTGRRSALARWITARDNPLAARVAVNHIWARHFGRPLVKTVFDFGRKGAAPSHPELLDWLACELVESGWSMKHVHRLIVTSSAYRMSSASAGAGKERKADPENLAFWRMNSVRMEAQVVRDGLLSLAGELDSKIGGPPVPANAATMRRSMYFFHSHNEQNRFLSIFDDANVLECYRRSESILPQQALALENSALAQDAAEKIAARIDASGEGAFIKAAFELVLCQSPSAAERAACAEALAEWKAIAVREKRGDPARPARAALIHSLLNHNDFVTIR
jgi:hypothetical protein